MGLLPILWPLQKDLEMWQSTGEKNTACSEERRKAAYIPFASFLFFTSIFFFFFALTFWSNIYKFFYREVLWKAWIPSRDYQLTGHPSL